MPNLVLFAVQMTEILHIEVFIGRTHTRHTDRQGQNNTSTSQPPPPAEFLINADSSIVVSSSVKFSLNMLTCQERSNNFFSSASRMAAELF